MCSSRSPFYIVFAILNIILILLGSALAAVAFYTMTLDEPTLEVRTYEYQYHLRHLMFATGLGGILAAITGFVGLVVGSLTVDSSWPRVAYEIMLLASGALLLVCGAVALGVVTMRPVIVDRHFRPIMTRYQHEGRPEPLTELHRFQATSKCCGLSKPPDPYEHLRGTNFGPLPWSCCVTYTSEIFRNPSKLDDLMKNVRKKNCTHNSADVHKQFCDQFNHRMSDWAFYTGIAAVALSLFCIILFVISCTERHEGLDKYEDIVIMRDEHI